jgi:nitroreductase
MNQNYSKDFFEVAKSRRSVRMFSGKQIPKKILDKLIDVIRYAPSSLNGQPWEVIVVTDEETKERLVSFKNQWCPDLKMEYRADFVKKAPMILVVCCDRERSYDRWLENGIIASTYVLLAVTSLGLGATMLTAFNLQRPEQILEARRILGIPETVNPVCIMPVGYPEEKPAAKKLRKLEDLIHYEKY